MAKGRGSSTFTGDLLPHETEIEVVRIDSKGDSVKKIMTFGEFKRLKKQSGYKYYGFQLKFSQFPENNKN